MDKQDVKEWGAIARQEPGLLDTERQANGAPD